MTPQGDDAKGEQVTAELGATGLVLLRSLMDPAAVLERDDDRRVLLLHGNPALAGILGRPLEELVGADADAVLHPDDRGRFLQRVHRALDEQCEVAFEIVRERSQGRSVHLGAITPVSANQVVVVERDISDERRSADRLADLEALSQTGTWSWSLQDGTMSWSMELRRIIGVGKGLPAHIETAFAMVHPDDRDRLRRALDEVHETGATEEVQYRVVRPSGEPRTVCTRASRAVDQQGTPIRIYGTLQDVTRRRALETGEAARERILRQQDRAMQLNDDVVQSLARAWLALDLDRPDDARLAVTEGMETVRCMMTELLQASGSLDGGTRRGLRPGELAHLRAARAERTEPPVTGPAGSPS
jgi:PAS domain S-box-containing protein